MAVSAVRKPRRSRRQFEDQLRPVNISLDVFKKMQACFVDCGYK